jgi:hypothetical protein
VTAPSMTIVLACVSLAPLSIRTDTPAAASGSIPLERPHGAPRSAITRTSTPRSLGADERADDAGADCQPVTANEDPTLGARDRVLRETGAVILGGEADLDGGLMAAEEIGTLGGSTPIASGMAIANTP